jgi:chaperonin GroEL
MAGKKVLYSDEARKSLINGVDQVANAVKVTIGPRGRNVVINDKRARGAVYVINDGVSIAGCIELDDPAEEVGAKLLLQACSQTDSRAGDGTTTSAVLTQAMCRAGKQYVTNGVNAVALQRGLIKSAAFFVEKIKEAALPVTTIEQYRDIASISANSPEMGAVVADAIMRVGADGACTCEAGKELQDSLDFAEGLEHEIGMVSEAFVTDVESQTCTLDDARLFVTDQKLTTMQDILPILEGCLQSQEPLVIMALDISGEALSGLTLNVKKGVIKCCAVKTPGFGEVRSAYLEDICAFSGAKFCTADLAMRPSDMTIADCGKISKAIIGKKNFLIVSTGEYDEAVEKRVDSIKELMDYKINEGKEFEVQRLEQRINKLRGAVARIYIGAPTEAEIEDKRLRYEDAINALKGACFMGRVPGGGACYAYMLRYADECRALFTDPEEAVAVDVITEAMSEPIRMIAGNAGLLGEFVLQKVIGQEWGYGFNAAILEYEDLLAAGVCDPASVTTWALENSASISGSLLTTEALICVAKKPEEEEEYVPEVTTGIGEDAGKYAW